MSPCQFQIASSAEPAEDAPSAFCTSHLLPDVEDGNCCLRPEYLEVQLEKVVDASVGHCFASWESALSLNHAFPLSRSSQWPCCYELQHVRAVGMHVSNGLREVIRF